LRLGPKVVLAEFGVLHPSLAKQFGLTGAVVAGEIFLDAIPAKRKNGFMRAPYAPPALQAVKRDFAFVVDEAVEADALVRAVKGADKKAIVDARLFDVFVGPGVEEGRKSLAIEVTLQRGEEFFPGGAGCDQRCGGEGCGEVGRDASGVRLWPSFGLGGGGCESASRLHSKRTGVW
jgi:phenylalanyl-tRNA synthetase beta chain